MSNASPLRTAALTFGLLWISASSASAQTTLGLQAPETSSDSRIPHEFQKLGPLEKERLGGINSKESFSGMASSRQPRSGFSGANRRSQKNDSRRAQAFGRELAAAHYLMRSA